MIICFYLIIRPCYFSLFLSFLDVDECASSPCQNGATCNNGRDNYTCTCAAGWTSTNCDVGRYIDFEKNNKRTNAGDFVDVTEMNKYS